MAMASHMLRSSSWVYHAADLLGSLVLLPRAVAIHAAMASILACAIPAAASAQRVPALSAGTTGPVSAFHEAAIALQGVDSAPFLDSSQVARVADVLRQIRAKIPDVAAAPAEGQFWSIEIWLDTELGPRVQKKGKFRGYTYWGTWDLKETGVPELDRLNKQFNVRALRLQRRGLGYDWDSAPHVLRLDFRYAMNLTAVGTAYARVPGVQASAPSLDEGIHTGNLYRLTRQGPLWELGIDVGTGDCRSGCSSWMRYVVQYDERTGEAHLLSRTPVS